MNQQLFRTLHIADEHGPARGYVTLVDAMGMAGNHTRPHALFRVCMPVIYHVHLGKLVPFEVGKIESVTIENCYIPPSIDTPSHTQLLRAYKFAIGNAESLQRVNPSVAILAVPLGACIAAWYDLDDLGIRKIMGVPVSPDLEPFVAAMRQHITDALPAFAHAYTPKQTDAGTHTDQELPKTPAT
jgi:hypothetical protein